MDLPREKPRVPLTWSATDDDVLPTLRDRRFPLREVTGLSRITNVSAGQPLHHFAAAPVSVRHDPFRDGVTREEERADRLSYSLMAGGRVVRMSLRYKRW